MWDLEGLVKAATAVGVPVTAIAGITSKKRRLRNEIRENLALVEQIEQNEPLKQFSVVSGWLHGRIALDVAKLTGQDLGTDKKPIPWLSVFFAALFGAGFGFWTYWIDRDGFIWYSVFPGVAASLMAMSVFGMFIGREKAPEERGPLPPGAVAAPTETATERVATALAIAATGGIDNRLQPGMQADVVLRFVKLLQLGAYAAALELADETWLMCRVQAWLWNNREHFGPGPEELDALLTEMLDQGSSHPTWSDFVQSENYQFMTEWSSLDIDSYGVAGHRRRVAADLDVVILAPVGPAGGYFVMTATAIPNAMVFLVRYTEDGWRVANHIGISPPAPGWPPTWWTTDDPTTATLPDPGGGQQPDKGAPAPEADTEPETESRQAESE